MNYSAVLRKVLVLLVLFSPAAKAADTASLLEGVRESRNLTPLFEALDTRALASEADLEEGAGALLEKVKPRLQSGQLAEAEFAGEAAGQTLRLGFADGGLNYLTLQFSDEGELAGWYDHALGVHLAELVAGLAELGSDAPAFLETLDEEPLKALESLPDSTHGQVLSRLVLAACGARDCYPAALEAMQVLRPVRTSLWRYERAVQREHGHDAELALEALEAELGRDPGLAWLRHARAPAEGRCDKVRDELEKSIKRWPDYRPLYPLAAQCAAMTEDWAATTRWFQALEQRFGQRLDLEALRGHPVYGDYLESESYRQWREPASQD